jgi:hypothetical protein
VTAGALKAPDSSLNRLKPLDIAGHRYDASDFTAARQIAALHFPGEHHRHGVFTTAKRVSDRERPWQEHTFKVLHAGGQVIEPGAPDQYVSMQSFSGWRRVSSVKNLGCCYVDLDYRKRARWQDSAPETVFWAVMQSLDEQNIPPPSYCVSTGNGLCLVWLHSWLPAQALPRWDAVQSYLAAALCEFGADKNALDATRVFRIIGSKNTRARDWRHEIVRPIYVRGDPAHLRETGEYLFDDLADEVLPIRRAELHSLQAERAKRRAEKDAAKPPKPATRLDRRSLSEAILADLHRLRYLRTGDGLLPAGQRDQWLFCASVALAYGCPPAVLKREILSVAAEVAGWSEREALGNMGAVIRRARIAARGETFTGPNGQPTDPRYSMSAATIIERLEITPTEMRSAGLRVLVDADRRRELNTARTRVSRHRRGATPRAQVQAKRQALGKRAIDRSAQGETLEQIAASEGVSRAQVSRSMKEVREK